MENKELSFYCSNCKKEMTIKDKSCQNCDAAVVFPESSIKNFKNIRIGTILYLCVIPITSYFLSKYLEIEQSLFHILLQILLFVPMLAATIFLTHIIRRHNMLNTSGTAICYRKINEH